ncbi:MAG: sulfatase-like hydrolase/transferase [Oscillospiraceae bacterium]
MKKPNILLLHADQHRFDCIGCYGNNEVKTPNIDALANDGVRYTEHYTVYPVCTPSRYSMLSGQYTHQHCAWTNVSTLPSGFATFPKLLKENGYHTTTVGKMHLTPTYHDVGFEKMILSEQNGEGRFEDDYHTYLMDNGLVDVIDLTDQVDEYRGMASKKYYDHFGAFESDLALEHHSTSWITRQALADIEEWNEDGGNLLMVGYIKPHHPFDPPAPYSTMYDPSKLTPLDGYTSEVPQGDFDNHHGFFDHRTLSKEKLQGIMANYYGTITQIDDNVGEIIQTLKERGIYDDTIIIYTSDHGEYLGYHHMLLKGNFLYDPLAKIPLIIKYPKATQKQTVNDSISENIDLCTTILSCCNINQADSMCGIDLSNCENGREYAFSEGQYGTDKDPCNGYMIRTKNYKLIVSGSFNNAMFFDLKKDKNELHNEIDNPQYSDEIKRHKDMLIDKMLFSGVSKNHQDHNAPQLKEQSALDAKTVLMNCFIAETIKPY